MDYQTYEAENFGNVPPPEHFGVVLPRDFYEGCDTTPRFLHGMSLTNDYDLCNGCGRHIFGVVCEQGLCGSCRFALEQIEDEHRNIEENV